MTPGWILKGILPTASSIHVCLAWPGGLYEQDWINNMEGRAKPQAREQNKNHVEKTRFKKPNFGDHQSEEDLRPSGSEDLGLDKCNDG